MIRPQTVWAAEISEGCLEGAMIDIRMLSIRRVFRGKIRRIDVKPLGTEIELAEVVSRPMLGGLRSWERERGDRVITFPGLLVARILAGNLMLDADGIKAVVGGAASCANPGILQRNRDALMATRASALSVN